MHDYTDFGLPRDSELPPARRPRPTRAPRPAPSQAPAPRTVPAPTRAPSPAPTPAPITEAPVLALDVAADGVVLLVVGCPYCRSSHRHGGGDVLDVDFVRRYLGHREAHCPRGAAGGYDVVDTYGVLPGEVARLSALA